MNLPSLPASIELAVSGMTCNNCAKGVERLLQEFGATDIAVNAGAATARFRLTQPEKLPEIRAAIQNLGYKVDDTPSAEGRGLSPLEIKFLICLPLTLPLLLPMWLPLHFLHQPLVQLLLSTPVFIVGVRHFGRSALAGLKMRYANMDVLILLSVVSSYLYSLAGYLLSIDDTLFFETSATIVTIVLFGNLLEERAVRRTTSAIDALSRMAPTRAKRIVRSVGGERSEDITRDQINAGDLLAVNIGDQIPVDGTVTQGTLVIDQSMLTGESMPVEKFAGDKVLGGTIVRQGSGRLRADRLWDDTVFAKVIEFVKDAQARRPQIQRLGDKVSSIFVPVVGAISFLTLAISWLLIGLPFADSLMRAVAVLVVACPCAMGLATPTAIMVGIGHAARNGILVKGGDTLEQLAQIRQIAFDKTGTLTEGRFRITEIKSLGAEPAEVRSIVRELEEHSSHPLARSLVAELADAAPYNLTGFEERPGVGLFGAGADGRKFALGGVALVGREQAAANSGADLFLTADGKIIATIAMTDALRDDAPGLISALQSDAIKTILISGDRSQRCREVAAALNLDEWHAEKLPQEKAELLARLGSSAPIAFAGDGINDAPSLSTAAVGISLQGGSPAALQSAQVVMLSGKLGDLGKALRIARLTLRLIKQNLFWAFIYNIMAIPLAASGQLTPAVAALAMTFSDLCVILNSLRLRLAKI